MSLNRLHLEKSPYLIQHSRNPVDWFPWGDEAFQAARRLDRPIFLSIGYASCHWCHVMERESFEDPEIARLLNEHFIAIKVDREELPEVDTLYMSALHAMGQPGGWPLSMFLDTDLKPFFGGTYFPPEPRPGLGSFRQILLAVARLWASERAKIAETGRQIHEVLETEGKQPNEPPMDWMALTRALPAFLASVFDEKAGGFRTSGSNKFPPSLALMLLLRLYRRISDPFLLRMVETTLKAIRRGGIYDQIGGGIARYATDERWLVPHFEKMLYDNALFVMALTEAFRVTQNNEYRVWAEDVIQYVDNTLTSADGVFYSSEDADQEGGEGDYYLWSRSQLESELMKEGVPDTHINTLLAFWGVTEKGNFEGKNILHETQDRASFAAEHDIPEDEFQQLISKSREILRQSRRKRTAPALDDKVLLSWNALMISALARAGFAFASPALIERAEKAMQHLTTILCKDGRWMRRYRDGDARFPALLSDIALLGLAFLDLYRSSGRPAYYTEAATLAESIVARFVDADRIHEGSPDPALFVRLTECYDGVQPSGPSAALQLFAGLARYGTNTSQYHTLCMQILSQFSARVTSAPHAYPAMLSGVVTLLDTPDEFAVTGEPSDPARFAVTWIGQHLEGETILARCNRETDPADAGPSTSSPPSSPDSVSPAPFFPGETANVPLLVGKDVKAFGLYVCRNMRCEQPLTGPLSREEIVEALRRFASPEPRGQK